MSLTYVCGYTGSPASRRALEFATRLAAATGADVLAITVFSSAYGVPTHVEAPQTGADVRRETVLARGPAHGLHEAAERFDASLLCVGGTHHGWLGRAIPGSVAHHLLHGSSCAVAVVPQETRDAPMRTIGVAYDDTDEGNAALAAGAGLAGRLAAGLVVISAVDLRPYDPVGAPGVAWSLEPELTDAAQRERRELVERVAGGLSAPGGVRTRVVVGFAGHSIVDACREGVDLLVAGSRGFGPLRSVFLGSVSRYLADHAPCPVILLPRGSQRPLDAPAQSAQPAAAG